MTLKFSTSTTVLRAKPRISIVLLGLRDRNGYSLLTWDIIAQHHCTDFCSTYTILQNIIEHVLCVSIPLSTRNIVVKKEDKVFVLMEFLLLVRETFIKKINL